MRPFPPLAGTWGAPSRPDPDELTAGRSAPFDGKKGGGSSRPPFEFRGLFHDIAVGVDDEDVLEAELADLGFDLGPVADDDPDHRIRVDRLFGGGGEIPGAQLLDPVRVLLIVIVREAEADDL